MPELRNRFRDLNTINTALGVAYEKTFVRCDAQEFANLYYRLNNRFITTIWHRPLKP